MDLLCVRGSVWNIGRSVRNVHIKGLILSSCFTHTWCIPHSAGEFRDTLADVLFKNAGLEIKPFIMVQQVLLLKAGKELDLNSMFLVVSS